MKKKYSNRQLQTLANIDLLWVKKSAYYKSKLEQSLKAVGCDAFKLFNDPNSQNDIIHEEQWIDVCEVVNRLAAQLLEEREEREKIIKEFKSNCADFLLSLK